MGWVGCRGDERNCDDQQTGRDAHYLQHPSERDRITVRPRNSRGKIRPRDSNTGPLTVRVVRTVLQPAGPQTGPLVSTLTDRSRIRRITGPDTVASDTAGWESPAIVLASMTATASNAAAIVQIVENRI